ncbi:MAG: metallophosphoesterase family protein [Pseudomonadota bacterium]
MTLRLAHLSDIHFGCEHVQALAAARDWIENRRPDLAVITGDLTRAGAATEFAAARDWIADLPVDSLVAPGNHDVPYYSLFWRLAAPWRRWRRHFPWSPRTPVRRPGLAIAQVNTARGAQARANWSKGAISRRQVARAVDALAAAEPGDLRIVACHHPLIEMVGAAVSGRVHGGRRAAAAFTAARVDLVMTGHVHVPFALPWPGGDGRTWAVGAGTLSVRERGAPAGFNCLEIEPDRVCVTALGWTGSRLEPWRTWAIDRRPAPS